MITTTLHKMKKIFILSIFVLASLQSEAQQENQYTQFMFNKLSYNPAFAGESNKPILTLLYRNQWLGFDGNPESKLISFDASIIKDRVGFGLVVANNSHGIFDNWHGTMAYSYKVKFSESVGLRFGIQGTIKYYGVDFNSSDSNIANPNDPSVPLVSGDPGRLWRGNFGMGAYLTYEKMYVGLSVPNFLPNFLGYNGDIIQTAKESPHFYGMIGGLWPIAPKWQLKPGVLLKYVENAPFDADLNLSVVYDYKFHVGASYRLGGDGSGESIDILAFFQTNNLLGIGLAYDFPLSQISNHTAGSLEALLRLDLVKEKADLANPRFFD